MKNEYSFRGAVIGCGFWAAFQIAAWQEVAGVEIVAVCDREADRANATAKRFGIARAVTEAETLLREERLDFVDIITDASTHAELVLLAVRYGVAVIVQKPMATDWETAQEMVSAALTAGVPLLVHENFRWQAPLRRVKALIDEGVIGPVFKARLSFCSAFPVFDNQPALARLPKFILTDVGTHILDVARFLLGEATVLYCRTVRVNPNIHGEDVADILLEMQSGAHCFVEMSYASLLEHESFPQTLAQIEGRDGSLRLGMDGEIVVTTRTGTGRHTRCEKAVPISYSWADPAYTFVHAGIVACHQNLLDGLCSAGAAETTGADNLRTLQLVFACYRSAEHGSVETIE